MRNGIANSADQPCSPVLVRTCPRAVPVDVEAGAGAAGLHLAAAQPAAALPFVGDLAVVLDTGGVGAEHEAVLPIAIGVDDHLEAVGVVERPSRRASEMMMPDGSLSYITTPM